MFRFSSGKAGFGQPGSGGGIACPANDVHQVVYGFGPPSSGLGLCHLVWHKSNETGGDFTVNGKLFHNGVTFFSHSRVAAPTRNDFLRDFRPDPKIGFCVLLSRKGAIAIKKHLIICPVAEHGGHVFAASE